MDEIKAAFCLMDYEKYISILNSFKIKDGRYHRSNGFEFFLAITIGVLLILIIFY